MATILPPQFPVSANNPCGLDGLDFVEFVSSEPARLDTLFKAFGFSRTMAHASKPIDLYEQGDITFQSTKRNTLQACNSVCVQRLHCVHRMVNVDSS